MAKLISNTYGDALFELALESNKTDELLNQVEVLQKVLAENPDFIGLLSHPQITKEEKLSVVSNSFDGKFDNDVVGLLRVVIEKDRAKDIGSILEHFRARVYEYKQIGVVYVTSATDLTAEEQKKIEAKLLATTKYKSLEMNFAKDASLIGGVVIRIGDRVIDSSIKNKMEKMTNELRKVSLA